MAAVSIAIVGRDDKPVYCNEFPTKYHWEANSGTMGRWEDELFGLEHLSEKDGQFTEDDFDCSLKQQFILHAALDRFVQLAGPPPGFGWRSPGVVGVDAYFVGLLCPVEDYRVYGYVTSTKLKIIVVVEDDEMIPYSEQPAVDDRIKALMAKIHKSYVEYTLNPFNQIEGTPIKSKTFKSKVERDVEAFNRALS
ncbi:particle complex subunit 2-like protein [Seminavis robusta]|uniref:Particle complex subunit 2-like protein n=1 Tax=Seminavis robusta TaxID=568900 RepID=A0A9N8E235_9STRA|nr:particle complex subunit 2-like protein [Seminavis robusta]|eukprot:Sro480_g151340.1 particle complex subunit 2-like protein (194) ;mRNA; f:21290-21977